MMTSPRLRYNERAWAIDLISYINKKYGGKQSSFIRSASGELSLDIPEGNTCFPDLILFGDNTKGKVLQGWELKMPDTSIDDRNNIDNAEKKARVLALKSFLVWNVEYANLYTKDEVTDTFGLTCTLYKSSVKLSREDVKNNPKIWQDASDEIITKLNTYFEKGLLRTTEPEEVFSDNGIITKLLSYQSSVADYLTECRIHNKEFDANVKQWWDANKDSYPGHQKAETPLAGFILFHWLNKFLFINVMKAYNIEIENNPLILNQRISIQEAMNQFRILQGQIKGWNFLGSDEYDSFLPPDVWKELVNLFSGLSGFPFSSISNDIAKNIIQSTILLSIQHTAGLFATPANLAELLIRLTINKKDGFVMDPFCGTGTIARLVLWIKSEDYNISGDNAVKQTYASDKYGFPILIAQLALAMQNTTINEPLNIFLHDAFTLHTKEMIYISDDKSLKKELPEMDSIVSNIPFVRSELIKNLNSNVFPSIETFYNKYNIPRKYQLTKKSDLSLYIPFILYSLLSENGDLGIIITNSWLTTDSGKNFRQLLLSFYNVEYVVISGKGRWFKDTKVVATLLCCQKKAKPSFPNPDDSICFCTINNLLNKWDVSALSASIITHNQEDQNNVEINEYTIGELNYLSSLDLGWNSCFSNVHWFIDLTKTRNLLIPIDSVCDVSRGERRGWDSLFYPSKSDIENNKIEKEFISPVLMTTRSSSPRYTIEPDASGFCCNQPISCLEKNHKYGALRWIKQFEKVKNNTEQPLSVVLKRPKELWYEMKASKEIPFVINVNPDKCLYFMKLSYPAIINQRLLRLATTDPRYNNDFVFALLNSSLVLFQLEAFGGGMGEGALNLNASKLKLLHIPNPACYSLINQDQVCKAFSLLTKREILPINKEVEMIDRKAFDLSVLAPLGLENHQNTIYKCLIDLFNVRMAVFEK